MREIVRTTKRYIAADKAQAARLQFAARSPNTWRADKRTWQRFSDYLGAADPWKASSDDVAAWCAKLADEGYHPSSIESALSSLNFYYERLGKGFEHGRMGSGTRRDNPARSSIVRATMRGIHILYSRPSRRSAPLSLDQLDRIIAAEPTSLVGLRNRALIALCWAGAFRTTEVTTMDIDSSGRGDGYVEFASDGLVVTLKRSKSKRGSYAWERYGIPSRLSSPAHCPRVLLRAWLDASGLTEGPLFPAMRGKGVFTGYRMNSHSVCRIVRRGVEAIGFSAREYSGRSLRSSCITWLVKEGVHPARIMEHSGHKNLSTMFLYLHTKNTVSTSALSDTSW